MPDLAFANVDITLRLTAAILGLDCRAVRAVLKRHVSDRLQVAQVPLVGYPELSV